MQLSLALCKFHMLVLRWLAACPRSCDAPPASKGLVKDWIASGKRMLGLAASHLDPRWRSASILSIYNRPRVLSSLHGIGVDQTISLARPFSTSQNIVTAPHTSSWVVFVGFWKIVPDPRPHLPVLRSTPVRQLVPVDAQTCSEGLKLQG